MFELTIAVDDVDRFVADPGHQGSATGYVESDLLGGRLEVERGWFNLFVEIDDPESRQMLYRLWLRGPGRQPDDLHRGQAGPRRPRARRVARHLDPLRARSSTATSTPGDDDGSVLAAGDHHDPHPGLREAADHVPHLGRRPVGAMEGFGRLFLGQLWEVYGRFFRTRRRSGRRSVKRSELAEHFVELNFMPQDACRWLSPSELKTLMASDPVSAVFGNYADKRELQKVLRQQPHRDAARRPALPRAATSGSTTPPTSATASRRPTRWRP